MREEISNKINFTPETLVDLRAMAIKDDEVEEITLMIAKTRPNVSEIFLNNNFITNIGAQILKEKLSALPKLAVLDLQFNQIDKSGAFAIFSLYTTNPDLQIPFYGNKIENAFEKEEIVRVAMANLT